MSTNSMTVRHRRRWPVIVAVLGLVLLAAALTTTFFALRGPGSQADDIPAPPAATSAPATTETAVRADGCLGGTDPAVAVLKAQQEAPLTATGAAEFIAAAARWTGLQPAPADRDVVAARVFTTDASESIRGDKEAPPGTRAWVTTDGGLYRSRLTDAQRAEVDFKFNAVVTQGDASQQQITLTGTGVVVVEDGKWHWRDTRPLAAGLLEVDGIPYRGGC